MSVVRDSEELSGNAISSDMQGPQRIALELVYHHGQYFLPVVAICGPFWDYLWLNDVISGWAFCWLALPAGLSFGNWMLISKQYE